MIRALALFLALSFLAPLLLAACSSTQVGGASSGGTTYASAGASSCVIGNEFSCPIWRP